jgi:hypothetical protein
MHISFSYIIVIFQIFSNSVLIKKPLVKPSSSVIHGRRQFDSRCEQHQQEENTAIAHTTPNNTHTHTHTQIRTLSQTGSSKTRGCNKSNELLATAITIDEQQAGRQAGRQ